jgi:hypothetical protein
MCHICRAAKILEKENGHPFSPKDALILAEKVVSNNKTKEESKNE